jgi:hypothetical protein
MDAQTVEIVGRNYLISQLVRDGLEVARPERDRGVDLIAYLDLDETGGGFVACPIQMKAASARQFGVARKYEKFAKLLFAYVWNVHDPGKACSFCLTYPEALDVAEAMGWTKTASWQGGTKTAGGRGIYDTSRPSAKLVGLLESYRMGPGDWKRKVRKVGSDARR